MPQMASISWLSFNVMNYNSIFPATPKFKISNKKFNNYLNWKW